MPYGQNVKITDPAEARVSVPVRIPWRAREELHEMARERGISLNQLLTDALTAALGIEFS